jgi:hypothetical protein
VSGLQGSLGEDLYRGRHDYSDLSPSYNKAKDIPAFTLARASSLGKSENALYKSFIYEQDLGPYVEASAAAGTTLHMLEEKERLKNGTAIETERLVYDPVHRVSGHIDVIEAGGVPADVKTVSRKVYEKIQAAGKPKASHIDQVQFYAHVLKSDVGRIHYIMREDPTKRLSYEFKRDDELIQKNFEKLARARARVQEKLASGELSVRNMPKTASLRTLLEYEAAPKPEYSKEFLEEAFRAQMAKVRALKHDKFRHWNDGGRIRANITPNVIDGMPESGMAQGSRTDFGFGSGWLGLGWREMASKFIDPIAEVMQKMAKGKAELKDVAKAAGVEMIGRPIDAFPAKKFLGAGSGRTVFQRAGEAYSTRMNPSKIAEQAAKGEVRVIPAVASERALKKQLQRELTATEKAKHGVAMIHEKTEALMIEAGRVDMEFVKKYHHANEDVLRVHGYGVRAAGYSLKNAMSVAKDATERALIKEGWMYKHMKEEARRAVKTAEKNIAAQRKAAERAGKLKRGGEIAQSAHNPIHLNKYRTNSHGKNG